MKNLNLLLAFFFLSLFIGHCQTENSFGCLMEYNGQNTPGVYSCSTDTAFLSDFPVRVYNIFFWGINKDDQSNTPTINQQSVLANIAHINREYNQYNIYFKLKGYDNTSYNSTPHWVGSGMNSIWAYAQANGYVEPNSFNFYVPGGFNIGGGQALPRTTVAGVNKNSFALIRYTILHELAHCFNIMHTFDFYSGCSCERVTRDINAPEYNACDHGDYVVDTAAVPWFSKDSIPDVNYELCLYIGNGRDCDPLDGSCVINGGSLYEIYQEDMENYMAKGTDPPGEEPYCKIRFTTGQKIRMHETAIADQLGFFSEAETTIASLYEPYQGNYNYPNEESVADMPMFQPGFDYRFILCSCEDIDIGCADPSPYHMTSFDNLHTIIATFDKDHSSYAEIVHPNHTAIVIDQLDINQARKCWDNWEGATSGKVVRFLDNVINANVTITLKDSTSINSETLIEGLPSGLYLIEKCYNDGSSNQTVISKGN